MGSWRTCFLHTIRISFSIIMYNQQQQQKKPFPFGARKGLKQGGGCPEPHNLCPHSAPTTGPWAPLLVDFSRSASSDLLSNTRVQTSSGSGPSLTCPDPAQDGSQHLRGPAAPHVYRLGPPLLIFCLLTNDPAFPTSCDSRAHPSAAQPVQSEFNDVMTAVITIVNHLPAISSFCRSSAMWQLPRPPCACTNLSWPHRPPCSTPKGHLGVGISKEDF